MLKLLVLFLGGLGGLAVAFAHPIGPALVLLAIIPFDAIPFYLFGPVLGNVITYLPILAFLALIPPIRWGQVFTGTRIQQVALVFILSIAVSHVMVVDVWGYGILLAYLRKLTILVLVGIFAWSFRDEKHLHLAMHVLVVSMALYILLSLSDFYLGTSLLPVNISAWSGEGALSVEYQAMLGADFRFKAAGLPVSRTANYLLASIVLGFGLIALARNTFQRLLAVGCVGILGVAILATVSRSALGSLIVAILLLMVTTFRFRPQRLVVVTVMGALLGSLLWIGATQLDVAEGLKSRFGSSELEEGASGRLQLVMVGFKTWGDAPILGVGASNFVQASKKHRLSLGIRKGLPTHNSYLTVLAEHGLLGFIPFAFLLLLVLHRFSRSLKRVVPGVDAWRPYFQAAFVAQLVMCMVMDYNWERFFWLCIAFAATLEHCTIAASARARAEVRRSSASGVAAFPRFGGGQATSG